MKIQRQAASTHMASYCPGMFAGQYRCPPRIPPSQWLAASRVILAGRFGTHLLIKQGGGERLLTTPAPKLYPGGGDGYREAELVFSGDGSCDPSPGTPASGGDKCRRIAPSRQALPSGRATNFVPPLDFTLNRIECFPSFCASETVLRNSVGVVTGLPPTSRMMSPTSRP